MKTILVPAIFFGVSLSSFPQWHQQQNIPTDGHLTGIVFPNPLQGWISCANGQVLHTADGGQNWELIETIPNATLTDIFFADGLHGWASGELADTSAIIISTIDGGNTWNVQFTGDYHLAEMFFTDTLTGWVGTQDNALLHTTDGGASWVPVPMPALAQPMKVQFLDHNVGFVGGTDYDGDLNIVICKTTDGGQSWDELLRVGGDYFFSDMFFTDESNGWLTGRCMISGIHLEEVQKKFIWYTRNGGQGWNPGYESDGLASISVCFSNPQKGWAVTQGGLFLGSFDGGENWAPVYYPPYVFLNDLTFSDSVTGWAVGSNGTVMKTDNNGALGYVDQITHENAELTIYPNPVSGNVSISFELKMSAEILMEIYDSQGKVIKTIPYKAVNNGYQTIKINLEQLPPGLYLVGLRAEGFGHGISGRFVKL